MILEIEGRARECGGLVVLVGHALHHDLRALKLDYWPIIDTAHLYSYAGMPSATPGLADLAEAVLGRAIRQGQNAHHSAVEDAMASLKLAQYQLDHGASRPLPPPKLAVS